MSNSTAKQMINYTCRIASMQVELRPENFSKQKWQQQLWNKIKKNE